MYTGGEFGLAFLSSIWRSTLENIGFSTPKTLAYKQDQKTEDSCPGLGGAVVVITGSNTGIGKEAARTLVRLGATVILACRNQIKGLEAARSLNDEVTNAKLNGKAIWMELDLESLKSVIEFTNKLRNDFSRVDVLINNAGSNQDSKLENGMQSLFQVNYLGHYLLFTQIVDLMQSKRPYGNNAYHNVPEFARVINLSSVMHHMGQPDYEASALDNYSKEMKQNCSYYSDTKLYMNLMTHQINKLYGLDSPSENHGQRRIIALSVNPGAVKSDIWRHLPWKGLWDRVMDYYFLNVEEGSKGIVYASTVTLGEIKANYQGLQSNALSGQLVKIPNIPYIIPYYVPPLAEDQELDIATRKAYLSYELLGKFQTPHFAYVSVPEGYEKVGEGLWQFSKDLCNKLLDQSEK